MPEKSCDLDLILTSVLYDCLDEIIPIVTSIWSTGIVPQCFKHALVRPLLKRPVLIPAIWNTTGLYPTHHSCQMYWSVLSWNSFTALVVSQPSRAVPVCLSKVSQHWDRLVACSKWFASGFRQWLCVCCCFFSLLDLSAAFDTTDHNILLTRLRSTFGCSGTVLDWFISYLSRRIQSVSVGHESTPAVLKCGVPRGFVLGPLLFTLYTHSLSTVICQSGLSYHFFADESQLHKSSAPSYFLFLPVVWKIVLKMSQNGWVTASWRWIITEPIAIGTRSKLSQVIHNLSPMSISGCDIRFSQSC